VDSTRFANDAYCRGDMRSPMTALGEVLTITATSISTAPRRAPEYRYHQPCRLLAADDARGANGL